MALPNAVGGPSAAAFQGAFAAITPLILGEWPQVGPDELAQTAGELEKVTQLVAERTAHTRALVQKHLGELLQVALAPEPRPGTARAGAATGSGGENSMEALVEQLEKRTAELLRSLRSGVFEGYREKARDNLFVSLLIALGLGFIVGVLYLGSNRGHGR